MGVQFESWTLMLSGCEIFFLTCKVFIDPITFLSRCSLVGTCLVDPSIATLVYMLMNC